MGKEGKINTPRQTFLRGAKPLRVLMVVGSLSAFERPAEISQSCAKPGPVLTKPGKGLTGNRPGFQGSRSILTVCCGILVESLCLAENSGICLH